MRLRDRVEQTLERTERALEAAKAPGVMCSFGKDSLVLVHLMRHLRLPVIVCRPLVYRAADWVHAASVVRDWGLDVRFVQPVGAALAETPDGETLVTTYELAPGVTVAWTRRIDGRRPDLGCALTALDEMPPAAPAPGCDVLLCGQKNGDPDFLGGAVQGLAPQKRTGRGVDFLFPLCDWTDAEVWSYAAAQGLPLDSARYDLALRREHASTRASNDRVPLCTACARREGPDRVPCPLRGGRTILRRADRLPWLTPTTPTTPAS